MFLAGASVFSSCVLKLGRYGISSSLLSSLVLTSGISSLGNSCSWHIIFGCAVWVATLGGVVASSLTLEVFASTGISAL